MPIIGGTASWAGPVIGAVLLASVQQIVTVTVSSELNVLVVGVLLVAFVVAAPQGMLGLVERLVRRSGAARTSMGAGPGSGQHAPAAPGPTDAGPP
jgi:branched-chain amino acid transport system permease protein